MCCGCVSGKCHALSHYRFSRASEFLTNSSNAFFELILFYFNSCLNPVIYALFYSRFRKAVKLIVTLQILHPGSREANVLWRGC